MSTVAIFTNNGSVRTAYKGKGVPAYACWKKIEAAVKGDNRWIVDPSFLEYSSFHKWHTHRGKTEGLVMAYNCVGYDDFRIGPDTSALLPKKVWAALLSRKPGLTAEQRLEHLRDTIKEHESFFMGIPKVRILLWNYRYEPDEATGSSEVSEAPNPYAVITQAIAEKVNYNYDTLSDDVLFQLYFDLQESMVEEGSRIRIPAWVHLYGRILEAVKATPAPKPVEPEKPLTIEEQVVELTRDVKMAVDTIGEFEGRLDKLVEMIKPSVVSEMVRNISLFRQALQGVDTRLTAVAESVVKENTRLDKVISDLVSRVKHLEDLQLDKMEPTKAAPAPVKVTQDEPLKSEPVKPEAKALPEVVIVGLAPENAQRIAKEYQDRLNTIILPLNVTPKRLKAVCKDRTVFLMTAFSGHSVTNSIKSSTNKLTTVGNGITSLIRELDTYLLREMDTHLPLKQ